MPICIESSQHDGKKMATKEVETEEEVVAVVVIIVDKVEEIMKRNDALGMRRTSMERMPRESAKRCI